MFESLVAAPPDPILGLNEAFQRETNPRKINLGVGVYKDGRGRTPVLECVKQAERLLLEREETKSYLGIEGRHDFTGLLQPLLFGSTHAAEFAARVAAVQTPGGTGALRVAADFIKQMFPQAQLWISKPTWANHPSLFEAAGLPVREYAYFDAASSSLNFSAMKHDLSQLRAGDVVLLHGCCHNPTGVDPTPEQWQAIGQQLTASGALPLIDFAYQGFGDGLDEDAAGLRSILAQCREALICSSYSKNFGLYCERVGALVAVTRSAVTAETVLSQIKRAIRTNYSNPPSHGAAVVATVLADPKLTALWHQELAAMRDRINETRALFVDAIQATGVTRDFSFIRRQRGMFSFTGLTGEQVDQLRDKQAIYMVRSGRINVAGITAENVGRLAEAIADVL